MKRLVSYSASRWRRVAIALAGVCALATAHGDPLTGVKLLETLRQGGCVLVMRHASSPAAPPDRSAVDPENLTGERQLDATGRSTAQAMGQAIKRLGIPIAQVLSSPTYRARETVRIADLGSPEVVPELDAPAAASMQAAAADSHASWLRQRVSVSPPAHSNTLIVTHAPNILGAFGSEASAIADGETLVFRPDHSGGDMLLARIKIEDWSKLSKD